MKDRNENRPGYKKTKVGWIPKEWQCVPFKECCRIAQGQVNPTDEKYREVIYIGPENIESNSGRLHGTKTAIELGLESGKYLFDNRAIVYSKIRPNLNKVCIPSFNGLCSADCYPIWPLKENNREYIYHFMLSSIFLRQSVPVSLRTGMPKINRDDLNLLKMLLPPLPEQKKIADILFTWDEAIEQTRNLIEAKKHHKKALMQQLLMRKRASRSYDHDNCSVKPLKDLIEPVSRSVPKPQNPYLSIGIRSHGKGTFQKIVQQPEKVMMDTLYRIEENDLLVNITFAWEGAIAIASERDSGGLVSHRFPTFRIRETEADIDFLRDLVLTKRFVWDLGLISPGGAGRNRVLNQKDFLQLKVLVPSLAAQKGIGKILAAADNELSLWENYLKALEKQKRGLMQKLLTGEVRVTP